jgi:leucyl aminopeptidase
LPTFVAMKWTFAPSSTAGIASAIARPDVSGFSSTDVQHTLNARSARGVHAWLHEANGTADHFFYVVKQKDIPSENAHVARKAGVELAGLLAKNKCSSISVDAGVNTFDLAEGLALAGYRYTRLLSKKAKDAWTLEHIEVVGLSAADAKKLEVTIAAVSEARDLINTPVLDLTAVGLAQRTVVLGKLFGFKVNVLNQAKIESLKMGGLLGVNRGSLDPATFSILEYKPNNAVNSAPYILVGKGVVYDTGGLSLKPSNSMDTMKCDMSGAAAVIGTFCAVAGQQLPVHVIGLIPATDNRPGGNAITPGDVLTISDGTTVEVLNTDAEGRLILADALHYAKKYKPQLVIDLATLTGAAARAIGPNATVAMGNAGRPAWDALQASAERTHERLVEFPFWDEYNDLLKSEIADLKNIGGAEAGAITAGKFLEHFTDYPYVHLDIAGPAFLDQPWGYYGKGGTGVGVRLLTDFLANVKG